MDRTPLKLKEAGFYKKLADNKVRCDLCEHRCLIRPDKVGVCRTRKNIKGTLYSLDYGRPVAIHVDPIEKKPLFHFLPGSLIYSLGTLGCNFRCLNCQNYDISQSLVEEKIYNLDWVKPEEIIKGALESDCQSIAYTYNEPTIFTEYALDIMKLAHKNNLKNVWVSNGFMSEQCLKEILPYLEAINIDLKSLDDKFYGANCGAKLEPVLKNLKRIKKAGVHLEVTTLLIPTLSDDKTMLKKIAEFIKNELGDDTPWHLSRFSSEISWRLKDLPNTDIKTLEMAYDMGKKADLKYVYLGNVLSDKENTYCPQCHKLAISRQGYIIKRLDQNGHCTNCQADLSIV